MINNIFGSNFIEELKSKCDIVSTMSNYLTLQKKGKTYWACCPFHYEKTPSFAVSEMEQYYHCFGCGESGDIIKFIEKYENLSFVESIKLLAKSCKMELPTIEVNSKDMEILRQKEKVLKALNLAMNYYKNNLKIDDNRNVIAEKYLEKRRLDKKTIDYFNIGYSIDWESLIKYLKMQNVSMETMKLAGLIDYNEKGLPYDFFGTRLMFPIINSFGDCIGFTARTLEQDAKFAKYKNSPQTIVFDKSKTIYNIKTIKDLRKQQNLEYIIICEGTVDVISMFKEGFCNTVACMGTAITSFHAKELRKYTDKILLCLDGDSAGQNGMYKAIDVFRDEGLQVKVVTLKDNLDPDEFLKNYGKDDMKICLDNAIDAIEYKLRSLALRFDLTDLFQKSKYLSQTFEIINSLDNNSQKEIYLKILSKIVNISIDVLRKDISSKNTYNTKAYQIEENKKDSLFLREDSFIKAQKFILASIVHKKIVLKQEEMENLVFINPSHKKLFDFVSNTIKQNKTYTISSLFDYFNTDEDNIIKEIIDFDFSPYEENLQIYFDECLNKVNNISKSNLQEKLISDYKKEVDLDKKREIMKEIQRLIKNKQT